MGKINKSREFISTGSLFSGESSAGATTTILNVSKLDNMMFYADSDTGGAGFAGTISVEISRDGTNFTSFRGLVEDSGAIVSGITLNTASSEVFSIRELGAYHSLRFTLNLANVNASTSVNLLFSSRSEDTYF